MKDTQRFLAVDRKVCEEKDGLTTQGRGNSVDQSSGVVAALFTVRISSGWYPKRRLTKLAQYSLLFKGTIYSLDNGNTKKMRTVLK